MGWSKLPAVSVFIYNIYSIQLCFILEYKYLFSGMAMND